MEFTKAEYEKTMCQICGNKATGKCKLEIEYTVKNGLETMKCKDYLFVGGKTK